MTELTYDNATVRLYEDYIEIDKGYKKKTLYKDDIQSFLLDVKVHRSRYKDGRVSTIIFFIYLHRNKEDRLYTIDNCDYFIIVTEIAIKKLSLIFMYRLKYVNMHKNKHTTVV